MARRSSTALLITVAVLLGLTVLALVFSEPLMDTLASLHGRPAGH